MKEIIGIYKITNLINSKVYVGASTGIKQRWGNHRTNLNNHRHSNTKLQTDWDLYGKENFVLEVLEEIPYRNEDLLLELENHYKSLYFENTYNTKYDTCVKINCRKRYLEIPDDESLFNRTLSNIEIVGECWNSLYCIKKDGYPVVSNKRNRKVISYRASRISYYIHYRQQPGTLLVCHSCDNPLCINPAHLFLGTDKDNKLDMAKKGRGWVLTWEIVRAMREDYLSGMNLKQIESKYNYRAVWYVIKNKVWYDENYSPPKTKKVPKYEIKNPKKIFNFIYQKT